MRAFPVVDLELIEALERQYPTELHEMAGANDTNLLYRAIGRAEVIHLLRRHYEAQQRNTLEL